MVEGDFKPRVSVIVPIYNGEADLPDLLDCLRSQTYARDRVEFLLINNNSSDKTEEILLEAEKKAQNGEWRIKALREDTIQSSYAARNCGIREATGEILLFTDADCRPLPDWIAEIVLPFTEPSIGIVVGELEALSGNSLLEKYADLVQMMSPHFLLDHCFRPYGQTANLAIRAIIFRKIGLFRPYLTTGGDADICWRIQQATHWQLTFAPQAIIRHRHRHSWRELRSQWQRYGRANRYLHELHNIDLMSTYTHPDALHRIVRWLLKEVPRNSLRILLGRAQPIELIKVPIDLFTYYARSEGQTKAKLPNEARAIDWLEPLDKPSTPLPK